jgi:hypothetical protein
MLRFLTIAAVLGALGASARAGELEDRLAKKLAEPFVTKAAWVLDFDEAKKKAKEDGKVIFAYFSRSFAP